MAKFKANIKECQLTVRAKLSFKEKINERQLDFFAGKYVRGLLKAKPPKRKRVDYYGPIGISLYERLKKPISKYEFLFVMEQVVDIVQRVNANSLIISNIVFDIHNVFINEITKELQFIYLPLENMQRDANIIGFMEQIIYASKPIQEADTEYVSRFVYSIKALSRFDADKIEKIIFDEDRSIVNTIKRHNVGQSGFMTDKRVDYYAHYDGGDGGEATGLLDEEATGLLNEEATGLLNEAMEQVHFASLFRNSTNETILINKPVFRIGKERRYSDYLVTNNDMVSRSHANIITRSDRYYIVDLDSKNRSYVNGNAIPAQQEIEIHNGDNIRLANEEFEFRT